MRTHNILSGERKLRRYPYDASSSGAMNDTHKLKLPLSQTYFHSSKGVRATEVLLYVC